MFSCVGVHTDWLFCHKSDLGFSWTSAGWTPTRGDFFLFDRIAIGVLTDGEALTNPYCTVYGIPI